MKKTRILWLSNHVFSDDPDASSGTWLGAMGRAIAQSGKYELYNISQGRCDAVREYSVGAVAQITIPWGKIGSDGLPSKKIQSILSGKINAISPDVIHVWGTEAYWGLFIARHRFSGKFLIDIQGILSAISAYYLGDLSFRELLSCQGLKELIRPNTSILAKKIIYGKSFKFEQEVLKRADFIACQSDWSEAHLKLYKSAAKVFRTLLMLRREFYAASQWEWLGGTTKHIFVSVSADVPYKGLHSAYKVLAMMKKVYGYGNRIILHVAGELPVRGIRQGGYSKWLERLSARLGVADNIVRHGALNAAKLIALMRSCDAALFPSFIESYGVALAEAQCVGVPCVVAYAGAMPELCDNGNAASLFRPGDTVVCAALLSRVLEDKNLAVKLSSAAFGLARKRHQYDAVLQRQLEIYGKVTG